MLKVPPTHDELGLDPIVIVGTPYCHASPDCPLRVIDILEGETETEPVVSTPKIDEISNVYFLSATDVIEPACVLNPYNVVSYKSDPYCVDENDGCVHTKSSSEMYADESVGIDDGTENVIVSDEFHTLEIPLYVTNDVPRLSLEDTATVIVGKALVLPDCVMLSVELEMFPVI